MLHIAVCDDENTICVQIETILMTLSQTYQRDIDIEVFHTGEDLCRILANGAYYDLIFLDIELKQISGIEVGQIIREKFKNETTQIIYISGKDSYAMELFEIRPFHFLIKPLMEDKIDSVVRKAIQFIENGNLFFEFKNGHTKIKIMLKDILYFESNGKKIQLIMQNDGYEFYGKLSEISKQLESKDFIQIHKSYLVNYYHVAEYQYESIKMSDNTVLAISQQQRKIVRERLLQRRYLEAIS